MNEQLTELGIKYTDRGGGCIDIVLTDGITNFSIHASYVYDPFPDMIC